jgi:hypothetical protein
MFRGDRWWIDILLHFFRPAHPSSDYPKIMSFGWLEKCYLEQNPREDFVPVTASKPAKISPIKRKSHPQEDNVSRALPTLVRRGFVNARRRWPLSGLLSAWGSLE